MTAARRKQYAMCQECGRRVEVYQSPTTGLILVGHRTFINVSDNTRGGWCSGGGKEAV